MKQILISILVPTHNRCRLLQETLETVFQQEVGLDQIELIISNDGSTDSTKKDLDQLKLNFEKFPLQVFHHEKNLGGPGNWKFLLDQAKGEFVYLLSDDDAIKPDFLKHYLQIISENPTVDLVYSGIEYCDDSMRTLNQSQISSVSGLVSGTERLKNHLVANHMVMSSVYRRSTFLKAGGWQAKYGTCIDGGGFAMMCTQSRQTYFIPKALFCFRIGSQTWSSFSPQKQKKMYQCFRLIIDDVVAWALSNDQENISFYRTCYAAHAQGALNMLDLKIVHEQINKSNLKELLQDLRYVFPEVVTLPSFYKMQLVSYFGVRWLEALREWLGKGIRGKSVFEKEYTPQGVK